MSHDTDRLSALVDGELDHDTRDRLLAHLTRCERCRAVVESERAVKATLQGLPEIGPSADLDQALLGLSDTAGHAVPAAAATGSALSGSPSAFSRFPATPRVPATHRRRVRYGMVGGLSALGTVVAVAFASTGAPVRQEPDQPAVQRSVPVPRAGLADLRSPRSPGDHPPTGPSAVQVSFDRAMLVPTGGR